MKNKRSERKCKIRLVVPAPKVIPDKKKEEKKNGCRGKTQNEN